MPGRPLRMWGCHTPVALLASAAVVALLAACDANGFRVVGPASAARALVSGSYDYTAWSHAHGDVAWWGIVDLRVESGGRVSGTYFLPRQCSDRFGPGADCVGHVGGRVFRDGEFTFGFDEGWLSHEGAVSRRSDVTGHWWTRILGFRDDGVFELRRR
jgi:hypothetical protein